VRLIELSLPYHHEKGVRQAARQETTGERHPESWYVAYELASFDESRADVCRRLLPDVFQGRAAVDQASA
jgi:hypothetical protein